MKLRLLLLLLVVQKSLTSDFTTSRYLRESNEGQEISHPSLDLKIKSIFLSRDRSLQEDGDFLVTDKTDDDTTTGATDDADASTSTDCNDYPKWMETVRYIALVSSVLSCLFIVLSVVPFLECLLNFFKVFELLTGATTVACIAALMYGVGQKVSFPSLPGSLANTTDIFNKTIFGS